MNMKKTIAAVAACAVAVSAMATTVSAEEGSLKYNLVHNVYKTNPGSVTYTATIAAEVTTAMKYVQLSLNATDAVKVADTQWTVTGYNMDANNVKTDAFSYTMVAGDHTWMANANAWVQTSYGAADTTSTVTIPVGVVGIAEGAAMYMTITAVVPHTDSSWGYTPVAGTISYFITDNSTADNTVGTGKVVDTTGSVIDLAAGTTGTKLNTPASGYTAAGTTLDKQYPMVTNTNTVTGGAVGADVYVMNTIAKPTNVYGNASNILSYLDNDSFNLSAEGKSYVNVIPVLNDVIANYDDVTFTFNTATKGVKKDGDVTEGYKYSDDADADTQYKSFGQHLYNLYGDENTQYVYSSAYDWSYYNLFSGALVINGQLSMSLNDTNTFDYGATSLSFNWEDATEGATVNTYVTYLQKMQLATSTTWFWDSMDVVYADASDEESVESGEGTEAEEDTIGEEEEEVTDEEVVDEAEEEVEAPAEEEAPAAEETNPGTGNAPIALAVIPVALAAAAIVAKKRG